MHIFHAICTKYSEFRIRHTNTATNDQMLFASLLKKFTKIFKSAEHLLTPQAIQNVDEFVSS